MSSGVRTSYVQDEFLEIRAVVRDLVDDGLGEAFALSIGPGPALELVRTVLHEHSS